MRTAAIITMVTIITMAIIIITMAITIIITMATFTVGECAMGTCTGITVMLIATGIGTVGAIGTTGTEVLAATPQRRPAGRPIHYFHS